VAGTTAAGAPHDGSAAPVEAKARVLIAADHLATRTGFRLALADSADCSEADDAGSAVAAAIREQPDVCVVDFDPPGRAIRAAAEILSKVPRASVVVMTRDRRGRVHRRCPRGSGRLPPGGRRSCPAPARDPQRDARRGCRAACARPAAHRRAPRPGGPPPPRPPHAAARVELTSREWEVVDLLRKGMSTRAIAELLGISAVTVRRHISAVHGKLGVGSRAELLRLLLTDGEGVAR
jgi:Response regulator containing a CheY-like receiver domain and an HTH DNA-binding domain